MKGKNLRMASNPVITIPLGFSRQPPELAGTVGAGGGDELAQFLDGQDDSGTAMHHAVAVGAERAQAGHGVNHVCATAGQRVQVMYLDVGTGIGRAVKRIEVEAARHARHAVRPYRGGAVALIAFVGSALSDNFPPFSVTAGVFNAMSCVFGFYVCLRSGFDVCCQTLKTKLKSAGATFVASTSSLRLAQSA
jgi:hypothetical protein